MEFVKDEIQSEAIVKKAYKIRNNKNEYMYIIEWKTWEHKLKVLRNKIKLARSTSKMSQRRKKEEYKQKNEI